MDDNPQILLPTWILLVILPNHFVIQMANNSNTFDICKQGQEDI